MNLCQDVTLMCQWLSHLHTGLLCLCQDPRSGAHHLCSCTWLRGISCGQG